MLILRSKLESITDFWKVLETTQRSQVAVMNLDEGQVSGDYGTDHPQADQWVYCLGGSGTAKVGESTSTFNEGDLLLIPAGIDHQLVGGPCATLNFYGPPAYPEDGK